MMHSKSSNLRNTAEVTLRIWRNAERTEEKLWEGRRGLVRPSHLTVLETPTNNEDKLKTTEACKKRIILPLK
jgi:hypothetical protein